MQVSRRLRMNTAVTALAIGVFIVVLVLTGQRVGRAIEQNVVADALITASFERLALRTDYLRTGSARAREQLIAKNEQVGLLLRSITEKFGDPEDGKTIATLLEGQQSIGKITRIVVANRQGIGPGGRSAALSSEVEDRLLSQLNMRAYESVVLGGRLQESSNNTLTSALRSGWISITLLFLLLGAGTLFNSVFLSRSLARRIGRLRDGAAAIGQGDLDHLIEILGDDEFSELAGSFNEMTLELRRSREDLEREIEERRQAEDGLRETAAELQATNTELAASRRAAINLLNDAITSRREAEQAAAALGESEEKLSLALRSAEMGIWRLDLRVHKRHFDAQVCRCLGIDPARFAGSPEEFSAAVHPDDRDGLKAALDRTIESGVPYEVEYRTVWPDGRIRHVAARGRLALDAGGQPRWVDGLAWDVTERKEAEVVLQRAHHELALQMEQRTKDLRDKEVLLKEVHHRVKNNLQVISSLVSLQADGVQDAALREVLREVTFRVRSMALVHEKLYQSADLARVDFAEYARSLLNYLWRAYGAAAGGVRLTLELEPLLLPVDIAVPCGLILNELAGNALKHAFHGRDGGEVTVTLGGAGKQKVRLGVRDDGVGIPPELDWRQSGSLGLRLVQMLAGQLHAELELDRSCGTEFKIRFELPATAKGGMGA